LVHKAVYGSFSGEKRHEVVVAKGAYLELLAVEADSGRVSAFFFLFFINFFFALVDAFTVLSGGVWADP
jgi:hypothetical protein